MHKTQGCVWAGFSLPIQWHLLPFCSPLFFMDQQYRLTCNIQNVPHSLTFMGLSLGYSPRLEWQSLLLSAFYLQVSLIELCLLGSVLDNLHSLHSHYVFYYVFCWNCYSVGLSPQLDVKLLDEGWGSSFHSGPHLTAAFMSNTHEEVR